jgi:hypothetical protein
VDVPQETKIRLNKITEAKILLFINGLLDFENYE